MLIALPEMQWNEEPFYSVAAAIPWSLRNLTALQGTRTGIPNIKRTCDGTEVKMGVFYHTFASPCARHDLCSPTRCFG